MSAHDNQVQELRDRVTAKRALPRRKTGSGPAKGGSSSGPKASYSDAPTTGSTPPERAALYKELCDKLAWSVGSTLSLKYGKRSSVMLWAARRASAIMDRAYPERKENPSPG